LSARTSDPGIEPDVTEAAQPIPIPPQARVYAAKFLCGQIKEGPVEPGSYTTAINVHNPNPHTVVIRKKAIVLFTSTEPQPEKERPKPPGKPIDLELEPDWGFEIDCPDIIDVLIGGPPGPATPSFIKGWVVIESPRGEPLNVVAVYTVRGMDPDGRPGVDVSIAVDRIPGTQVRGVLPA